jgi:hypothetical protein
MRHPLIVFVAGLILLTASSCEKKPKVIESSSNDTGSAKNTGIFSEAAPKFIPDNPTASSDEDLHTVTVIEVLPTSKYIYLKVNEGEEQFWIATLKTEVAVGKTYFYRGGLLKTNFESKEHNRVFDKMYLVSSIVAADHGNTSTAPKTDLPVNKEKKVTNKKGDVKIADIVANPTKYAGQTIQISGECVKVNPNIMGRHWIHLKDGSQDDYDLVITSDIIVPEGHTVTMTGIVALNKDFGAGYKYDIILEGGKVVQ